MQRYRTKRESSSRCHMPYTMLCSAGEALLCPTAAPAVPSPTRRPREGPWALWSLWLQACCPSPATQPQRRGALVSPKWIRCSKYPASISVFWVFLSFFFFLKWNLKWDCEGQRHAWVLWNDDKPQGHFRKQPGLPQLRWAGSGTAASLGLLSEQHFPAGIWI